MNIPTNGSPRKVSKLMSENNTVLRNFSQSLTSCFSQVGTSLKSYLYQVNSADFYGILLPIEYPSTSILFFLNTVWLDLDSQSALRKFQHEFWSDLFKSPKEPIGRVSEANYFIVPLQDKEIDWNRINIAVKKAPNLKLRDFVLSSRESLLLKASHKINTIWKYIGEINHNSTSQDFLRVLIDDENKLKALIEKYQDYDPVDVVLDESFVLGKEFRSLISLGVLEEFDELSQIVFVRQVRAGKGISSLQATSKGNKGVVMVPIELIEVFYLNSAQWEQGKSLLQALIDIENSSYALELCKKLDFQGDFDVLRQSMKASSLDPVFNNTPLAYIGKSLIKSFFALFSALKKLEIQENTLEIWKISKQLELELYLKTNLMKTPCFRPAFYASKEIITESYMIEHNFSEELLENFIFALVGAFGVACGLHAAGEFLMKIQIIHGETWEIIEKYFADVSINVLLPEDTKNPGKVSYNLYIPDQSSIENIMDYNFSSTENLEKMLLAFPNENLAENKNLQLLGKSIIEVLVAINLYSAGPLESYYFLIFCEKINSISNIAKLVYTSGLHKFIKDISQLARAGQNLPFGDNTENLQLTLTNFFYNTVSLILIDLFSYTTTIHIINYFFSKILRFYLANKQKFKKSVLLKTTEMVKKSGKKLEINEAIISKECFAQVFINDEFIFEIRAETFALAKSEAMMALFQLFR